MQAQHFKLGENKQVVLALDRSLWYTAGKLEVPKGIHIVEMPSRSPEIQRRRKTLAAYK